MLAGCLSNYSVAKAQSQGTTLQGMRKEIKFGDWIKTSVLSVEHQSAELFWNDEGAVPVIPNQPHRVRVFVRLNAGFFKGEWHGHGIVNATLQKGHQYFINGKWRKNNDKVTAYIWIQDKNGQRASPVVSVPCHWTALV